MMLPRAQMPGLFLHHALCGPGVAWDQRPGLTPRIAVMGHPLLETEDLVAITLDEQIRRYQDLVKRAADLRGYL